MFKRIILCVTTRHEEVNKEFLDFGYIAEEFIRYACHRIMLKNNIYKIFFFNDEEKYNNYKEQLKSALYMSINGSEVLYYDTQYQTYQDYLEFKGIAQFIGIWDLITDALGKHSIEEYFYDNR